MHTKATLRKKEWGWNCTKKTWREGKINASTGEGMERGRMPVGGVV